MQESVIVAEPVLPPTPALHADLCLQFYRFRT